MRPIAANPHPSVRPCGATQDALRELWQVCLRTEMHPLLHLLITARLYGGALGVAGVSCRVGSGTFVQ